MTDPTSRFPYLLSEPDEAEWEEMHERELGKGDDDYDFQRERD